LDPFLPNRVVTQLREVYLFHTGKSRWVISKRINAGCSDLPQGSENRHMVGNEHK
jgi:hypothetical protein